MLRQILTASALLLPAAAFAQTADIEPCDTPQYAGTYVVATGELIPPGANGFPEANTQVIYNNNADSGFFYGSADAVVFDEGRVPSGSSPAPQQGDRSSYQVNGFQIAYVTREVDISAGGPGAAMNVYFWEDYDDCADLAGAGTPTAVFTITGLPASPTLETISAWIVDIDLTGFEFCLTADADGVFDDDPDLDGFGYAYEMINLTAVGSQGPLITGDPAGAPYGDGTFYQNPGATVGTGLDNDDLFYKDVPGGAGSGCFWFGGAPFAGFHMVITAELDDITCIGPDCNGNGIDDYLDVTSGASLDCNGNFIPDECETDCNGNGIPDDCDIAGGTSLDCNGNGIPDECETDRNGNGVPDDCDLAGRVRAGRRHGLLLRRRLPLRQRRPRRGLPQLDRPGRPALQLRRRQRRRGRHPAVRHAPAGQHRRHLRDGHRPARRRPGSTGLRRPGLRGRHLAPLPGLLRRSRRHRRPARPGLDLPAADRRRLDLELHVLVPQHQRLAVRHRGQLHQRGPARLRPVRGVLTGSIVQ